jgi:hypothetical protein
VWQRGQCLKLGQGAVDGSWRKVGESSEQEQTTDEGSGEYEAMADGVRLERACEVVCTASEANQPEHQTGEGNEE